MLRTTVSVCVVGVVVLLLLALASAQPCIKCEDCQGSRNCLSMCKRECPKTVSVDKCKRAGQAAGRKVAKEACDLTKRYCRGGREAQARVAALRVTLQQCGNAAFGECQRLAKSRSSSPCGSSFNGVDECSASQFKTFYEGEVNERCNNEADRIEREGP